MPKHEVLGQGAAPYLGFEEGIDRVSDLVGDSASALLQKVSHRLQRDERGTSAATVRDLCLIGTHPPTSVYSKQTKAKAKAQPEGRTELPSPELEPMGTSQRRDAVLRDSHAAV